MEHSKQHMVMSSCVSQHFLQSSNVCATHQCTVSYRDKFMRHHPQPSSMSNLMHCSFSLCYAVDIYVYGLSIELGSVWTCTCNSGFASHSSQLNALERKVEFHFDSIACNQIEYLRGYSRRSAVNVL